MITEERDHSSDDIFGQSFVLVLNNKDIRSFEVRRENGQKERASSVVGQLKLAMPFNRPIRLASGRSDCRNLSQWPIKGRGSQWQVPRAGLPPDPLVAFRI